ncbi:5-formyltetrahydrofolate cyclo-ligase [bacterium]|nr:5-formyltetrahydrofolate cyclo-ligase [bacterium]
MGKDPLRRRMLAQLGGLTPATVRAHSAAVARRLAEWSGLAAAHCIFAYVSLGAEIDTHPLIRGWLAAGRRVCVPVFDRATRTYRAIELHDFDADLRPGFFGILEPRPGVGEPVAPADWEAVIVPGLAFDPAGNRLGHGRGHFDRLLGPTAARKVALAHAFQLVPAVPTAHHDVAVAVIITEQQLIDCHPRSGRGQRNHT